MTTLILVTLSIAIFCNSVAALGSYLVLSKKLDSSRLQNRGYRKNVWRKRYPLIVFNLSVLLILAVVGMVIAHPLFDMDFPGFGTVFAQIILLVLIDDAYFYFFHRALHTNPKLYEKIYCLQPSKT